MRSTLTSSTPEWTSTRRAASIQLSRVNDFSFTAISLLCVVVQIAEAFNADGEPCGHCQRASYPGGGRASIVIRAIPPKTIQYCIEAGVLRYSPRRGVG